VLEVLLDVIISTIDGLALLAIALGIRVGAALSLIFFYTYSF
jgi:hypothetical protein